MVKITILCITIAIATAAGRIKQGTVLNGNRNMTITNRFDNFTWPTGESKYPTPKLQVQNLSHEKKTWNGTIYVCTGEIYSLSDRDFKNTDQMIAYSLNRISSYINVKFIFNRKKCVLRITPVKELWGSAIGVFFTGIKYYEVHYLYRRETYKQLSTLLHEICHALGLDHNSKSKSVMGPVHNPSNQQMIYRSDITTLKNIWGAKNRQLSMQESIDGVSDEEFVDDALNPEFYEAPGTQEYVYAQRKGERHAANISNAYLTTIYSTHENYTLDNLFTRMKYAARDPVVAVGMVQTGIIAILALVLIVFVVYLVVRTKRDHTYAPAPREMDDMLINK